MRPAAGPRRAVTKLKCVVSLSGFDSRLRFRSHSRAEYSASLRAFARRSSRRGRALDRARIVASAVRGSGSLRRAASRVVASGAGSARDEPATAATREPRGARVATARGDTRVTRHHDCTGHARGDATPGSGRRPTTRAAVMLAVINARWLCMVYAYTDLPRPYSALPRANSVRPAKKQDHLMNNQHRTVSIDL